MTGERRLVITDSSRLDRAVIVVMPELSRSQARRLVEDGSVQVAGVVNTKPAQLVQPGTEIVVAEPTVPNLDWEARDVPLDILYEDEETLILNKPAGIIVHPRPGMNAVTLINAVRARYPEVREIDDTGRGGIVHRLDRDTSGVIALAKSEAAQYALKQQWRERETLKRYLAVVEGFLDPPHGMIDATLGADPSDPRRRAVVEEGQGQSARTEFKVLEQFGDEAALVSVRIYTGRTHQIRVHMAAIDHPVLGDHMYGRPSELIGRQALHARLLGLALPSTGEWREFIADLPPDLEELLKTLRRRHGVAASNIDVS